MSILKTFLQKNKGLALLTFVMICLEIAGTLGVPFISKKMLSVVSPIAEESHSRDYLIKKYVYSIHLFIFALLTYCNNVSNNVF
ncbi:hypothetical protein EfmAA818_25130 [Enterococcus faecium]|nr:hypothetical protein EfmAA818_25130 [Enterococcus faecium]